MFLFYIDPRKEWYGYINVRLWHTLKARPRMPLLKSIIADILRLCKTLENSFTGALCCCKVFPWYCRRPHDECGAFTRQCSQPIAVRPNTVVQQFKCRRCAIRPERFPTFWSSNKQLHYMHICRRVQQVSLVECELNSSVSGSLCQLFSEQ